VARRRRLSGRLLKKDAEVKKYLTDAEISEQFDLGYHFKHVDNHLQSACSAKADRSGDPWAASQRSAFAPAITSARRRAFAFVCSRDWASPATPIWARRFKHRSQRSARIRRKPNLRQVHLISCRTVFANWARRAFAVEPGELGRETSPHPGIDLLALPTGTQLHLGASAVVEITGLRNPLHPDRQFPERA